MVSVPVQTADLSAFTKKTLAKYSRSANVAVMNTTPPKQSEVPEVVSDTVRQRRWASAQGASIAVVVLSVLAITGFAATDHPHRATLGLVALLYVLAVWRALWPGRPWFASRHRFLDAAVYIVLGSAIWFLSPFTAMMLSVGS